jgi:hypothetical protein
VTNTKYAKQWKKMRCIALRVALGYLMVPGVWILNHLFIDPKDRLTPAFGIIWGACGVFLAWSMHQYKTWPCPRYGLPWQGGWTSISLGIPGLFFAHPCPHCGLELP